MLVNLSKDEMSTILYVLEGYVQGNDDEELVAEIDAVSYTHLRAHETV